MKMTFRKENSIGMDSYDLLQNRLQFAIHRNHLFKNPELHYLFFELTDQCNLRCLHCGSSCNAQRSRFLETKKVIETICETAGHEGRVHVVLTGGEPLLHPGFQEIIEALHNSNLYWSVVTNAMLLTDKTAEQMKKNRIYSAAVSLDGNAEEHNYLRRNSHAFDHAVRGIRILKNHGIYVQVASVITKRTLPRLEDLYIEVNDLHVDSWKVLNIEPIGEARKNSELLLDREELFRLFSFIQKKRSDFDQKPGQMEVTYGCSHFLPDAYEGKIRTTPFICGAGIMIASVQCNGDIAACLDIERRNELVQGNIYQDSLWDVWQNRFQIFRRDRTTDSPQCGDCRYALVCGGDSLHTWDFEHKNPNLCLFREKLNN
ncbi:MAG: radical SAM protein [Anaerolineaceae bacterium]|nr:radical SAM protein [Anaerolineaceae bacterium]